MRKLIIISIVYIILSSGCHAGKAVPIVLPEHYYSFFTAEEMAERGFVKKLDEFDTEVSIGFQDKEGFRHLFVFAVPIRYRDESTQKMNLIDERIRSTDDGTYPYAVAKSDFNTSFPAELSADQGIILSKDCTVSYGPETEERLSGRYTDSENLLGDEKKVILYDHVFDKNTSFLSYPTLLGAENETIIRKKNGTAEHSYWFDVQNAEPVVMDGYILFMDLKDPDRILGIIQAPVLIDSNQNNPKVSVRNEMDWTQVSERRYRLTVRLDEEFLAEKDTQYPVRYNLPVELRRDKQPDTPVYAGTPAVNRYLSNVSVIGEDAMLGEGKCYVRFVLASLFSINPDIIESVQYHTMSLNLANVAFYEVEEDWCSLTSTWETPITTGPLVAEIHDGRKGIQVFDLTKAARTWFADPDCLKERYGLLLASGSAGSRSVFLSHDNALYNCRTEIVIR